MLQLDTKTKFQFDLTKSGLLFRTIVKLSASISHLLPIIYVTGTMLKHSSSNKTRPLAGTFSWSLWRGWLFTIPKLQNLQQNDLHCKYKLVKKFQACFFVCVNIYKSLFESNWWHMLETKISNALYANFLSLNCTHAGILLFILEYVRSCKLNIILHKIKAIRASIFT